MISRVGTDTFSAASGTATPAWPATPAAGNFRVCIVSSQGAVTTPTGFTSLGSVTNGSGNQLFAFGRICDGSESGTVSCVGVTRTVGTLGLRSGNFPPTIAAIVPQFLTTTAGTGTAITAPQLVGVAYGSWLMSAACGVNGSSSANAWSVAGTGWAEATDADAGGGSNHSTLETCDNTTGTGTVAQSVHTATVSETNFCAIALQIVEWAIGSPLFFGS